MEAGGSVLRSRTAIIFAATDGAAECRGRREMPPVSYCGEGCGSLVLFQRQLAEKPCPERPSLLPFVAQLGRNAGVAEKTQQIVEASPQEGDVLRERLGTRDNAWLAERWQSHSLCRIELRGFEMRLAVQYDSQGPAEASTGRCKSRFHSTTSTEAGRSPSIAGSLLRRDGSAAQGSSSSSVVGIRTPIICPAAAACGHERCQFAP